MSKLICQLLQELVTGVFVALLALTALVSAAQGATPLPLSGYARPVIEQFLVRQTAGLSGTVQISIDTPLSGVLPACGALEAFLPAGASLRGRVSVGVRCQTEPRWIRYVQAHVTVMGAYQAAARQIEAGHILTAADTVVLKADMATLPASVVVNSHQLLGQVAINRIAEGAPVRREQLRGLSLVQQGQSVKVVSRGVGFVIATEGKAMTAAAAGALVQVRIPSGQLLSGTLNTEGIVERSN